VLNIFLLLLQDVVYTICSPCGTVLRIVIFKKNGVQSLVEYPLADVFNIGNAFNLNLKCFVEGKFYPIGGIIS